MTRDDMLLEIGVTLTRMRQEADARLQAMMADRPSVPALYGLASQEVERNEAHLNTRFLALTDERIESGPCPRFDRVMRGLARWEAERGA